MTITINTSTDSEEYDYVEEVAKYTNKKLLDILHIYMRELGEPVLKYSGMKKYEIIELLLKKKFRIRDPNNWNSRNMGFNELIIITNETSLHIYNEMKKKRKLTEIEEDMRKWLGRQIARDNQ